MTDLRPCWYDAPDVADFYDHDYRDRSATDLEFFLAAAASAGGPVLELGCGTGRVLVPAAERGCQVVGLDSSRAMLRVCAERLAACDTAVRDRARLVQADMRRFALALRFKLVQIPFRPFQHLLCVDDQLACLAAVREHLEPGGTLIIDVYNPDLNFLTDPVSRLEQPMGEPYTVADGARVQRVGRILATDYLTQVQTVELTHVITRAGRRPERRSAVFPLRWFYRYELEHLVCRAGFEVEELLAGYDRAPYGTRYPGELIVIARRPG